MLGLPALEQALTLRQPAPGLLIHADRGSQYTSQVCRQRSAQAGALASYARPPPPDNAQAEAGWSTLKTELLPHGGAFASLEAAWLEVAYYLALPTLTSTVATPPSVTAPRTNLKLTS